MKFFILVLLATSGLFSMQCTSYKDVKKYNGHYYTVSIGKLSFVEAMQIAKNNDGYLAIPNSAEENSYIASLIGKGSIAWIGVYDPDNTTNYCYSSLDCAHDDSRFTTVKNTQLSYKNWAQYQPDNLVKEYDILDGKKQVDVLGEHWVALSGNNGQWFDIGDHKKDFNNPVKYIAVFEFETAPECYKTDDVNSSVDFQQPKCNTEVYDENADLLKPGKTHNCQQDQYGTDYCPEGLAQAKEYWDYSDGYAEAIVKTYVAHSELIPEEKRFECQHDNQLIAKTSSNWPCCPGWKRVHEVYCNVNGTLRVKAYNQHNGIQDGLMFDKIINGGKIIDGQKKTFISDIGQGCNFPYYYRRVCNVNSGKCIHFFSLEGSTCSGSDYANQTEADIPYKIIPAYCKEGSDWTINLQNNDCTKTKSYTYYNYLCANDPNTQGFNWQVIDAGGDKGAATTYDPNPPANNCKRKGYTCNSNVRKPVWIDNQWQCSPFPCIGQSNIEDLDTQVGASDKNNDGWDSNGNCAGTLRIFNGKSHKCRSKDSFAGLIGGGCCNKDDVFFGLVDCKSNEKLLAEKNRSKLCHEIGEFCSKKMNLGFKKICIQKSKTYCCFNSKLARIFQEQGRPQLNKNWGVAENPDCQGFTPEEFQKLDFSQMNLKEFTDSIQYPDMQNIGSNIKSRINTNLNNMVPN